MNTAMAESMRDQWPVVEIGDIIVQDESGFACSKSKLVEQGLPHLRPFNVGTDGMLLLRKIYHIPTDVAPPKKRNLEIGDILFNNTNSVELVGKSAVVTEPLEAGFSNHITRICVDSNRVEPDWFNYFLMKRYRDGYFAAYATRWVGQAGFKVAELRKIRVALPSLEEQRHIIDILKRADGIRRLRKQAQDTARQLIPALFIEMFGDPLTNPRGWPEKSLGNLVSLHGGGTPSKKNPEYWGGVIPWVSPKDMKSECISDSIDHVTPTALEETTLKWVPLESVLIVVRGMILVHTVPIRINSTKVTINQDMKALVPNEELSANYLRWALQCMHSYVLSQVSTSAHGTRKLDTNRLLALSIPLPPLILQEEFVSRLHGIQSILRQQKAARNSAKLSFQSLLHRAFNGAI